MELLRFGVLTITFMGVFSFYLSRPSLRAPQPPSRLRKVCKEMKLSLASTSTDKEKMVAEVMHLLKQLAANGNLQGLGREGEDERICRDRSHLTKGVVRI